MGLWAYGMSFWVLGMLGLALKEMGPRWKEGMRAKVGRGRAGRLYRH